MTEQDRKCHDCKGQVLPEQGAWAIIGGKERFVHADQAKCEEAK